MGLGEFFDYPESLTTQAFQLESGSGDFWKYVAKFESGLTAAETVMVAKQLLAAHFCWKWPSVRLIAPGCGVWDKGTQTYVSPLVRTACEGRIVLSAAVGWGQKMSRLPSKMKGSELTHVLRRDLPTPRLWLPRPDDVCARLP